LAKLEKGFVERGTASVATAEGNIFVSNSGEKVKSVLITSSVPGEGKTISAISMAVSLAKSSGARVLLIDGNLNQPRLHTLFNLNQSPGFSDLFTAGNVGPEVYQKTEYESLTLLSCGSDLTQYLKLFRSDQFAPFIESLKKEFDYIIFDCTAYMQSSAIAMVAKHFDGVALVVEAEKTKWEVVQMVKDNITGAGGLIIGAILNKRRFYIPKAFYN